MYISYACRGQQGIARGKLDRPHVTRAEDNITKHAGPQHRSEATISII